MENKEFLGTEPIGKLLFKLAVPTVVAQLVNMLYNIVDRIYLGHMPGDGSLALTGVGVCTPIILFVSAFASLICAKKFFILHIHSFLNQFALFQAEGIQGYFFSFSRPYSSSLRSCSTT